MKMTQEVFIKLIDVMQNVPTINVNSIDDAKKTFNRVLNVVREAYGLNFEKRMAYYGVNSCISFRTWINDEDTLYNLSKYPQGKVILKKLEKSKEKLNKAE